LRVKLVGEALPPLAGSAHGMTCLGVSFVGTKLIPPLPSGEMRMHASQGKGEGKIKICEM